MAGMGRGSQRPRRTRRPKRPRRQPTGSNSPRSSSAFMDMISIVPASPQRSSFAFDSGAWVSTSTASSQSIPPAARNMYPQGNSFLGTLGLPAIGVPTFQGSGSIPSDTSPVHEIEGYRLKFRHPGQPDTRLREFRFNPAIPPSAVRQCGWGGCRSPNRSHRRCRPSPHRVLLRPGPLPCGPSASCV